MTNPVLRYLGSTKNIVGSAAGLAGLAATLPTGLAGDLWPVVVAGLYGAGALLAPREKAKLTVGGFGAVEATRLKEELASLQTRVAARRSRLAPDTRDRLDAVMASLTEILDRAEGLATSPDDLFVVGQTIRDYVPTSLEAYLNLPLRYAMSHKGASGKTPHEELNGQLEILAEKLGAVSEALYAGDAQKLRDQGRFLQDRFRGSSLDL